MQFKWLQKNNSSSLLLFFNGWAGDATPFKHLQSEKADVLMIYDYRELNMPEEVSEAINYYQKVDVVAWSFGVWVAQQVLTPFESKIERRVAVNGTIRPVHARYGIPSPIVLGTLFGLDERNLQKFQRRMLKNASEWKQFEAIKPKREMEEVKRELLDLTNHFKSSELEPGFYQHAIVGTEDRIMAGDNQLAYWDGKIPVTKIEAAHFCFFSFESWDAILQPE